MHTLQVPDMSKDTITVEFADVFRGLGNLSKYCITFKDDVQPVVHPARKIPHSLYTRQTEKMSGSKLTMRRTEESGPTNNWVHNLVIEKKIGSL